MIEFYEKIEPFHSWDTCGDFSIIKQTDDYYFCAIGDIGGHGTDTIYNIAVTIKEFILDRTDLELQELINLVHKQDILKHNGMTICLMKFFKNISLLSYVGVGNIKGMVIKPTGNIINLKYQDGIVGYTMPKTITTNLLKINKLDTIVLNTDGVSINQKDISLNLIQKDSKLMAQEFSKRYFKGDDDSLCLVIKYSGDTNMSLPKTIDTKIAKDIKPIKYNKKQSVLKNIPMKSSHNIIKLNDTFKLISLENNDIKTKYKLNKIFEFFQLEKKMIIQISLFLLEVQANEITSINIFYNEKVIQISIQILDDYRDTISCLFKHYILDNELLTIDILANNFIYEEKQFYDFKELLKFGLDKDAMLLNKKLQEEVDKKLQELLEKEIVNKKLTNKAYIDNLTGAYNRYKFEEVFNYEVHQFKRYKNHFSIAMIDIDHFKNFNDTHGHLIGDEVLIMLTEESKKTLRLTDTFARWGGEEFLILFSETTLDDSTMGANKLRENISLLEHSIAGNVTASFGISQIKENDTLECVLKRCDDALYRAKKNGRNRVEIEY
jgi:diguanylate cyclase (GGDEF)-like protein